jgi:Arc/MetJ-type ribon-helix-helix transcriptional regulator
MFDASFYGEHMIKTERIALRLEPQIREQAEKLTKEGKFKNLSEIVRQALTEFLAKNKPLDDMLREAFTEKEGINA